MDLQELIALKKSDFGNVLEIKNLFNSGGWLKYEQRLLDNLKVLNYNIQQLTNGSEPLEGKNLELLKSNISERKSLRNMLLVKIDLLDSVDPGWEEMVTSDRFGIEKDIENSPAFSRGA